MFEVATDIAALLILAAFLAGFVDSIAGGGGLITVPALLLAGANPVQALATNKLQGTFGSATAAVTYARAGHVRLGSQLPMAAIDEHRQLNFRRSSQIDQSVHGGPDGPAGEEHVVDQHDFQLGNFKRDRGGPEDRLILPQREVVPVECDVQFADRDLGPLDVMNAADKAMGQVHAPGPDAHQRQILNAFVALQDLMGDAGHGAGDVAGVHHDPFLSFVGGGFGRHRSPFCRRHKKTFPPAWMRRCRLSDGWVPRIVIMNSLPTSQDER